MKKLTRRQTIEELLRRYPEVNGPGEQGQGSDGFDSRELRMSKEWEECRPTWLELERCLARLRAERPVQWWHLKARYFKAVKVNQSVPVKNGKLKVPPHSELVGFGAIQPDAKTARAILVRWDSWVDNQKVVRAVDFIVGEFRGSPYLPKALLDEAAA